MRPVILRSNFTDYYDAYFDDSTSVSPLVFERNTGKGMTRSELLGFLERNGFSVPKHGAMKQIRKWAPHLRDDQLVVVYLDETSHRGENKLLLTVAEGLHNHPDCLAAEFLGSGPDKGHALRLLQVGMKYFWIELKSDNWRAGMGHVETSIKKHGEGQQSNLLYPLFAIDFVPVHFGGNEVLYAVDFSPAPIVGEYGIDQMLDGPTAAREIKQTLNLFHSRNR